MIILATASAAALLGSESATAATAETIADMGRLGLTICVESWSEEFVKENNKNGANIHQSSSYANMLEDLWAEKCDAVIYDAPLLEYSLAKAQSKGDGQGFGLVGSFLNFDPYGFALPLDHPLFRTANRVATDVVRDETFRSSIDEKYLGYLFSSSAGGGDDGGSISAMILIPMAIVLFTAIGARVYFLYKKDLLETKIHDDLIQGDDLDIRALREEAINVAPSDIAMIPSTNLVHDLALELNSVKRLVCELLIASGHSNTKDHDPDKTGPDSDGGIDIMIPIPENMTAGMKIKVALGTTGRTVVLTLPDGTVPGSTLKASVWTNDAKEGPVRVVFHPLLQKDPVIQKDHVPEKTEKGTDQWSLTAVRAMD